MPQNPNRIWIIDSMGFPVGSVVKNLPASAGDAADAGLIPVSGRSPGGGNDNHSSILAWRIPWTEGPGRLQSLGSQRVRQDWAIERTHARWLNVIFPENQDWWLLLRQFSEKCLTLSAAARGCWLQSSFGLFQDKSLNGTWVSPYMQAPERFDSISRSGLIITVSK